MESAEYDAMDAAEDGALWWYRGAHARLLRALRLRPGADGPVLDAGCGTGGLLRRLRAAAPGRALVGLEYDGRAAARARDKARVPVARGDLNALPFPDAAFGAVVSADVLCHGAVDPARALPELRRVLRPGGALILNLPAHAWLRAAHDERVGTARRFARAEARALVEAAGFAEADARHWNTLLFPLMAAQRLLLAPAGSGASSGVAERPSRALDAALGAVDAAERALSRLGASRLFPFGGSLLVAATRP